MHKTRFLQTRAAELALAAAIGGVGYYTLEVLWRGWSHWTMALTGALCFTLYYALCRIPLPLPLCALGGAAMITAAELVVGLVVNRMLGWAVWDYSALPFNFMGQISLYYSLLWFALCIPCAWLCRLLCRVVFGDGENRGRTVVHPR